jgi:hypothetical protein
VYSHTVPAGATKLLEFDSTANAVVSTDPSLTSAIWFTPTQVGPREVLWANGFFHNPIPVDVSGIKTIYVAVSSGGHYIITFDAPDTETAEP